MDAAAGPTASSTRQEGVPRVLVGVDGSADSLTALRWAMRWALVRGAEIRVLAAFSTIAPWTTPGVLDLGALDAAREDTRSRARAAIDAVRTSAPELRDVPVSLLVEPGPTAAQLVRHSAAADLLVVGSRGRSAVASALVGSVALHCVSSAECPVAVIPLPGRWAQPQAASRVVVGVDGSERSAVALSAAVTEAGPDGSVTAVTVQDGTDQWSDRYADVPSAAPHPDAAALRRTESTLGDVLGTTPAGHPLVQRLVLPGSAGALLVEQAADADLLVVASRGRGEISGLLLGSVAMHCVVHAPCPVLVVRPAARPLPDRRTPARSAASS